jgi:hypothetical protein
MIIVNVSLSPRVGFISCVKVRIRIMLGIIFSVKPRTHVRVRFRVRYRATDMVRATDSDRVGLLLRVGLGLELGLGLGSWLI